MLVLLSVSFSKGGLLGLADIDIEEKLKEYISRYVQFCYEFPSFNDLQFTGIAFVSALYPSLSVVEALRLVHNVCMDII